MEESQSVSDWKMSKNESSIRSSAVVDELLGYDVESTPVVGIVIGSLLTLILALAILALVLIYRNVTRRHGVTVIYANSVYQPTTTDDLYPFATGNSKPSSFRTLLTPQKVVPVHQFKPLDQLLEPEQA